MNHAFWFNIKPFQIYHIDLAAYKKSHQFPGQGRILSVATPWALILQL